MLADPKLDCLLFDIFNIGRVLKCLFYLSYVKYCSIIFSSFELLYLTLVKVFSFDFLAKNFLLLGVDVSLTYFLLLNGTVYESYEND